MEESGQDRKWNCVTVLRMGNKSADSETEHVVEVGMEESGQDRKWNCVTVLHVGKKLAN
jgi:hypothetical protein